MLDFSCIGGNFPITTIVTADEKGRLCIRGTKTGEKYLVKESEGGWWVTPASEINVKRAVSRNRKEWAGSKLSLGEHLNRMRKHGLTLKRHPMAQ